MDFAKVPEDVVPDDLRWTSAYFQTAPRDYVFEALPPQSPILLSTGKCIGIPSGECCPFYFAVPTNVVIRLFDDGNKRVLGSTNSAPLRRSWFGSTVDGILCRANRTGLTLQARDLDPQPNEIIFSLEIHNNTEDMIWPEKVCLQLQSAGLYCSNENLFGGRIQLEVEQSMHICSTKFLEYASASEQDVLELRPPSDREHRDHFHRVLCCCQNFKDT